MNTFTFTHRFIDTLGYVRLAFPIRPTRAPTGEQAELCSGDIRDYSHVYKHAESEARWNTDAEYTRRCHCVDIDLYWLLRSEVRAIQRMANALSEEQRDWFACAWAIVIAIEKTGASFEAACHRETLQLVRLAVKMMQLELASELGRKNGLVLLKFVSKGGRFPEVRAS